jgi:phage I-like protein
MDLNYLDLDWRRLLVKHYKYYQIDERGLSVIFCISDILSEDDILVTADDLVSYMTLSKAEIDELQKKMQKKDADEVVAKALAVGKITPDQKEWAFEYAQRDIKGFEVFVTKAPVVVPVGNLPGKKEEAAQASIDDATKTVAKMMDVSAEDIKKYGG